MREDKAIRAPAPSRMQPLATIGPEGFLLTRETLPSPKTRRWVARRKAEIVAAVRGGLLDIDEACLRYGLSRCEFSAWEAAMTEFGLGGLFAARRPRQAHRRPTT